MNTKLLIDQQITFIYTDDLDATARFYERDLGLDLALDQRTCRIYRTTSDAFLGICERRDADIEPGNVILTFVTTDVDKWYEVLKKRGVVFDNHCFFRDPNGYLIEIQRFENSDLRG